MTSKTPKYSHSSVVKSYPFVFVVTTIYWLGMQPKNRALA